MKSLAILLLLVILACNGSAEQADLRKSPIVIRVADGDSITVENSRGQRYKVRLSGIDAPELSQPFGEQSKQQLSQLVLNKQVKIEKIKIDQYGRWVAKVWVEPSSCGPKNNKECVKTLDVGMAQLTTGMAWWYRYWAKEQTVEDRGRYEFAEQEAKAKKTGLWEIDNPINPWQWRKQHPR